MCVILRKPIGVEINEGLVSRLWDANKDGGGYLAKGPRGSWVHRKGIMEKDAFINSVSKFFDKDSDLICHMRIKTVGNVDPESTHPFNWAQKNDVRYMFHNGTVKFLKPSSGSDSMYLAKMIQGMSTEEAHSLLKNLSANGAGRFVTLTGDEVNIFGDSESVVDQGVWFSNGRHLVSKEKTNTNHVHHYSNGVVYSHTVRQPIIPVQKPTMPVMDAERKGLVNRIATFYANRRKIPCTDQFIIQFCNEHGIETFATPVLEKVAEFAESADDDISDPLFQFLLAFQQ